MPHCGDFCYVLCFRKGASCVRLGFVFTESKSGCKSKSIIPILSSKDCEKKNLIDLAYMFSKKPPQLMQTQKIAFKSILNKGSTIYGNLEFSGNYTVMGQIVGDVIDIENKDSILWVDTSAYIKGNVQCSNLVLVGKLEGNVTATGAVEVCSGATIIGDIQSNRLHVDTNARINGRLSCLNGENLESVLKNMSPDLSENSQS